MPQPHRGSWETEALDGQGEVAVGGGGFRPLPKHPEAPGFPGHLPLRDRRALQGRALQWEQG